MSKNLVLQIALLLFFISYCYLLKAQKWETGIEIGASVVAPSSFDSQNGLSTVFFTPGIYAKRHLGDNWWIHAITTATRFNYYKNGTTNEEADTYLSALGAGKGFASNKVSVEVGLGLLYWRYYLNNNKNTNFALLPTLSYQITNPKKAKLNASLFVRYPLGIESGSVYGWFSTGTRIGLQWPLKK